MTGHKGKLGDNKVQGPEKSGLRQLIQPKESENSSESGDTGFDAWPFTPDPDSESPSDYDKKPFLEPHELLDETPFRGQRPPHYADCIYPVVPPMPPSSPGPHFSDLATNLALNDSRPDDPPAEQLDDLEVELEVRGEQDNYLLRSAMVTRSTGEWACWRGSGRIGRRRSRRDPRCSRRSRGWKRL